jgi:hypothetical protein
LIDTGSPYIAFDLEVARLLGLPGPFRRRVSAKGVGGADLTLLFPEDGEVRILLSDFVTEYFVWSPLIGFVEGDRPGGKTTALLGFTGFLQHFSVDFPEGNPPSLIEVRVKTNFPGRRGPGAPPRDA